MKKTHYVLRISLLLSLLLIALLCVSCGGGGTGGDDTTVTESDSGTDSTTASPNTPDAPSAVCLHVGTLTELPEKAATCNEAGLTNGFQCTQCNEMIVPQQVIEKIPHVEITLDAKLPTCGQVGLTQGKKCSVCDTVLVKQTEVPALTHLESGWIVDALPTEEAGSKHTECLYCHTINKTESIPPVDAEHVCEGTLNTTPATCFSEGKEELLCSCGKVLGSTPIASSVAHTSTILPSIKANCLSTGLTEGMGCAVCGKVLVAQTPLAMSGHVEYTKFGRPASCTEAGQTDIKKCAICPTVQAARVIPAKGHSFEDLQCTVCGIDEPYGIHLTDGLGNPINGAFVKVYQNGEFLQMHLYKGEFLSFADLPAGSYELELDLSQLDVEYIYDTTLCKISPESPSTAIRLYKTADLRDQSVYVGDPISKDYPAYQIVGDGSYKIELTPNDYTFIVFVPTAAAVYSVTYESESALSIGYHGSTFFVQGNDLSSASEDIHPYENGISISIYSNNLGGDYVFAIKSDGATECIFNIKNEGEPGTRLTDAPWTPYLEDAALVNAQLSAKPTGTYTPIDLTDLTLTAIYNPNDGYYHLGSLDGEIIYISLTEDCKYISSIQTICSNQRMGTYIYDTNGNVLEKRSYNELFMQYGMPADNTTTEEPIRVPLTEKIAEAIKVFGEQYGWWRDGADSNLFTSKLLGAPYNSTYAWLLYCGTFTE